MDTTTDNARENKALVIGGFGFVGSALVKRLLDRGDHVICFGSRPTNALFFKELARKYPNTLTMIYGQVIDDITQFSGRDDIGTVYHLAHKKVHSVHRGESAPEVLTHNYGVDSMIFSVVDHMAGHRNNGIRLVYISSGEVYGRAFESGLLVKERMDCILNPLSMGDIYAISKLTGEHLLVTGGWNFNYVIARLQNPYGPGMPDSTLIPMIIKDVVNGKEVFRYDQNNTRPYIYIADAVSALMAIADQGPNEEGKYMPVYNVASVHQKSIADVVMEVGIAANKTISYTQEQVVSPNNRMLDVSLLLDIGWRENMEFREGVRRTWAYFMPRYAAELSTKELYDQEKK